MHKLRNPGPAVKVALVGKYVQLNDAYLSVVEALRHACLAQDASLDLHWVCAEEIENQGADPLLKGMDAVVVPGGFGNRGVDGKVAAIRWAREQRVPFLGLCLGMQCAVIEWARNLAGLTDATSAELEPGTTHPVIHLLPEQQDVVDLGGTMRLGRLPLPGLCRQPGVQTLWRRGGVRAPSPPLRIQQRLPKPVSRVWLRNQRKLPRWPVGRADRTSRTSLLHRLPVPP